MINFPTKKYTRTLYKNWHNREKDIKLSKLLPDVFGKLNCFSGKA